MRLPISILVSLVFIVAEPQADAGVYRFHDVKPSLSNRIFHRGGLDKHYTLTAVPQQTYQRHKRAMTSFAYAWVKLLKTTWGVRKINHQGFEVKEFAKIGSVEDATKDFYSLGPKFVEEDAFGLNGQVENKFIMLTGCTANPCQLPPVILLADSDSPKNVIRSVSYFQTSAQAQLYKWKVQFP